MPYRAQDRPRGARERAVDVPLPGHYQCLVMQQNITLYPPAMLVRSVSVLRCPEGNVELGRWVIDASPWLDTHSALRTDLGRMLNEADYLAGGRGLIAITD